VIDVRKAFLGGTVLLLIAAFFIGAVAINGSTARAIANSDTIVIRNNAINGDEHTLELVKANDEAAYKVASEQAKAGVGKNNFGWNVYEAAAEHISAGEYSNVLDYVYGADEDRDFAWALKTDPCLAAAEITHYVNVVKPDNRILRDGTWQQPIGQQPNYAADEFIKDPEYWQASVDKFLEVLRDNATVSIVELDSYTSSMYMYHDGRAAGLPDIVVRNSTHTGGHALVFDFGKAGLIKLRLECGYQPVDVGYWTPPTDTPPEDDTTPPGTPDIELEPKDPSAGPQGQVPNNPDFGGGANDPDKTDKTQTSEPKSPDTYTPPKAPTEDKGSNNGGSKPSNNQSFEDRNNNGGTENVGGKDYTVITGTENKTIDEAQSSHSSDTVEEAVKGDDNSGSLDAPE
jgi:hypothetical protein